MKTRELELQRRHEEIIHLVRLYEDLAHTNRRLAHALEDLINSEQKRETQQEQRKFEEQEKLVPLQEMPKR